MAAQGYKEIQLTTPLKDSLPLILHNDEASITCSAGIEFPEENLKEGMLCFRSDLQRLFQRRRGVWVDILASLDNDIIELGEAIVEAFNEVDEVVLKTKADQSDFEKLKTEFEAFKDSVSTNYVSKAELQAQIDEAYASLAGT
ncbi:hypothetical protein [Parasutterella muris]|uniref:hypothetical protein n=1 Tax=Parasutterella muris TaxID=2565572 RepID=UPI0020413172|nr:hypothetical protein [Parasutterella muris]